MGVHLLETDVFQVQLMFKLLSVRNWPVYFVETCKVCVK